MSTEAGAPRRPLPLTAVLVFLAAANGYGLWLGLARKAELLARFPGLEPFWPVYVACPAVTLVALGALLAWRRWGLWLALGVAALVIGIELAAAPGPHVLRVPVAAGLLVAAVWPVRGRLR